MRCSKRLFSLANLLLICCLINGQNNKINTEANYINQVKADIYKSILSSQELQSDRKYHIVAIQSNSLEMKYSSGFMDAFYDIEEIKDTVSISKFRKELPDAYRIYPIEDIDSNITIGYDYISLLEKSDSAYTEQKKELHIYNPTYDIIKIYKPFDLWFNLYSSIYRGNTQQMKTFIPVKYEYVDGTTMHVEEKYFIFKVEADTANGGMKASKI